MNQQDEDADPYGGYLDIFKMPPPMNPKGVKINQHKSRDEDFVDIRYFEDGKPTTHGVKIRDDDWPDFFKNMKRFNDRFNNDVNR